MTVNDVANAVLAIGASPIMADDIGEVGDISAISSALVINMGTLNERTIASMIAAGKRANECGVPVVFDPVGAGASALRNDTALKIVSEVKLAVLRGNLSEVSFIAGLDVATKGVDSAAADEKNDAVAVAKSVADSLGCSVAITGAVDTISDGKQMVQIRNGHPQLSKVTGTGCMTSALVGSFAGAANGDSSPPRRAVCCRWGLQARSPMKRRAASAPAASTLPSSTRCQTLTQKQFRKGAKLDEKIKKTMSTIRSICVPTAA